MSQCQVLYNNKPLERVRHGKRMILRDHGIKSSNTLVVTKPGITLSITDPKVSMWYYMDGLCMDKSVIILCEWLNL